MDPRWSSLDDDKIPNSGFEALPHSAFLFNFGILFLKTGFASISFIIAVFFVPGRKIRLMKKHFEKINDFFFCIRAILKLRNPLIEVEKIYVISLMGFSRSERVNPSL